MAAEPLDEHQVAWLDRHGPMSPRLRAIVKHAVIDGCWCMDEVHPWVLVLRRYDAGQSYPGPFDELRLFRTPTGRFTDAHMYRCVPAPRLRLDDVEALVRDSCDEEQAGG